MRKTINFFSAPIMDKINRCNKTDNAFTPLNKQSYLEVDTAVTELRFPNSLTQIHIHKF